jgi:hypothetical protein
LLGEILKFGIVFNCTREREDFKKANWKYSTTFSSFSNQLSFSSFIITSLTFSKIISLLLKLGILRLEVDKSA